MRTTRRMTREVTSTRVMPDTAHHPGGAGRLGACEADGKLVEPVDPGDAAVRRLAVELEAIDVHRQEGQRLLQLGAREVRAQAVVDARAERGQPRAFRARDVEALGIDD